MKRIIPFFAAVILAVVGILSLQTSKNTYSEGIKIPFGESEEEGEARQNWEKRMLVDPKTGEIPPGIGIMERQFLLENFQNAVDRSGPDWTLRGPYNYGGRTRALVMDVNNENRLLAAGVSGGVWLSEDGGQSWQRKTPLDAHPSVVSIAQDKRPGKTNIWYYISGEYLGPSASGGSAFYTGDGMFKSTDSGNTWSPIDATDNGSPQTFGNIWQVGYRVVTDPVSTQDVVYAATYGAIYRSANGGTSWTAVRGNGQPYSRYTDVAITSTGVLYATLNSEGSNKGIWRSTNGTDWVNITPSFMPNEYERIVIGINPNNENQVYFFGNTPNSGHVTHYISSDDWTSLFRYDYLSGDGSGAGGNWTNLSPNLPSAGTEFDQCAAQGGYYLVVRVQPGTNNVFIGGTNIWRSTDGFTTPNNITKIGGYKIGTTLPFFEIYPNHHPDVHELQFLPSNPNVLLSGSDGGIHRTENCLAPFVEWSRLNNGYITTQFYTAIIDKKANGDSTLIGGLQDNGNFFVNSNASNALWKQTVNGDGSYGAVAPGKAYYVLSIQEGRVAKVNLDAQGNVQAFRRIDPIGVAKSDYLFINPLAMDPNDAKILYLPAGRKFYRQNDLSAIALNGQWDSISQGWTQFPDTLTSAAFSAIGVSEANPAHRVYLGTYDNKIYRYDNAHIGTPDRVTITPPLIATNAYINCIAVDPTDGNRVVLVYSNYITYSIWLSENAGSTWTKVAGNLETSVAGSGSGPSIRWVSILPFANGQKKYFCGTSVGLFSADSLVLHASTSPGTQWKQEGAGLFGATVVSMVETRATDGLVVAATHGQGMYTANFLPTISSNEPNSNQVKVSLAPNPTSDLARFSVSEGGKCTLSLYDLKGTLLVQKTITGGRLDEDISSRPAGVYLWAIQGKGWRQSGKLIKQ